MIYATDKDVERCTEIIHEQLLEKEIIVDDKLLESITVDIMIISYSTGGDYSNKVITRYAESYIERGLYKKFNK